MEVIEVWGWKIQVLKEYTELTGKGLGANCVGFLSVVPFSILF